MKKLFFDCGTRDVTASFGLLVLRISFPLMMLLGHGIPKIQAYATSSQAFYVPDIPLLSIMSPQVSYMAVIGAEVVAAAFLILGLATRPAAFVFSFAMIIAAFGALHGAPWFAAPGAGSKEPALLYLIPAITILLTGAGLYSLDSVIDNDKKRRRR